MNYKIEFIKEFDELCQKHSLEFDDALEQFAEAVKLYASKQVHKGVISLLETASEQLKYAAFNIYASYSYK